MSFSYIDCAGGTYSVLKGTAAMTISSSGCSPNSPQTPPATKAQVALQQLYTASQGNERRSQGVCFVQQNASHQPWRLILFPDIFFGDPQCFIGLTAQGVTFCEAGQAE